jgi:iron complex transport system substrate-binding protein
MLAHPALGALADTRRERFDRSLLWCGGPTIIRAAERLGALREQLGAERSVAFREAR